MTQLLDMCLTTGSTAEAIYTKLNEALMNFGIDRKKCVAFGVDNTRVNLGKKNSIKTRVQQQNSAIYFMGVITPTEYVTRGARRDRGDIKY